MPADLLSLPAFWFLAAVWLLAVGGSFGSFLNVVVYRLPEGMSLVQPPSHCPRCKHPIRWRDNLPVLGWLLLRGRCRDCRLPIPFRYPLVEAIAAAVFLAVGLVEGLSGGANLPPRPYQVGGETILPALTLGEALGVAAYHLLLLLTLLAVGLIEYDGRRVPARLAAPALLVGGLAPLVWPHLHPVPAITPGASMAWARGLPLVDGLTGLAVGMTLGLLALRVLGPRDRLGLVLAPACIGVFLGWQTAAVLGGAMLAVHAMLRLAGRRHVAFDRVTPGLWLTIATLGWILAWQWIAAR